MSNSYTNYVSMLKNHPAAHAAGGDIQACLKERSSFYFSEKTMSEGEKFGFDWALMLDASQKQKQVKRASQFINAISTGISTAFDKTHARLLVSMREAGEFNLTTDALRALAANKRSDAVNTRGVGLSAINGKIKGAHGVTTVPTKTSNSIGQRGFMQIMGMTFGGSTQNREIYLNYDHPAVIQFFKVIDNMSEGQLETLLVGKAE